MMNKNKKKRTRENEKKDKNKRRTSTCTYMGVGSVAPSRATPSIYCEQATNDQGQSRVREREPLGGNWPARALDTCDIPLGSFLSSSSSSSIFSLCLLL